MNSEQKLLSKRGRTVVTVDLTLYVAETDETLAKAKVDQWLQAIQNGNWEVVKALRTDLIFPSSWEPSSPEDANHASGPPAE